MPNVNINRWRKTPPAELPPAELPPFLVHLGGMMPAINGDGRIRHGVIIESVPEISVRHVIEHKPRPRPTLIRPMIINDAGERRSAPTIRVDGRHLIPVHWPLSWHTGNGQHAQYFVGLELELTYPGE